MLDDNNIGAAPLVFPSSICMMDFAAYRRCNDARDSVSPGHGDTGTTRPADPAGLQVPPAQAVINRPPPAREEHMDSCHHRAARLRLKQFVVACVGITLAGCGPYLRMPDLSFDVNPQARRAAQTADGKNAAPQEPDRVPLAGEMDAALLSLDKTRIGLHDLAAQRATVRRLTAAVLIPLSGWAVYKGVTSDSQSTKHLLALAGVTGSGIYAGYSFYDSPNAERAYLEGYRDLTCVMIGARPLLITQSEFEQWQGEIVNLETIYQQTDLLLSRMQSLHNQERDLPGGQGNNRSLEREFRHVYDALKKARTLLDAAHELEGRIKTAGSALRRKAEIVQANVNFVVQANESKVPKPGELASNQYQEIVKTYAVIKPVEQPEGGGGGGGAGDGAKGDGKTDAGKGGKTESMTAATEQPKPAAGGAASGQTRVLAEELPRLMEEQIRVRRDAERTIAQLRAQLAQARTAKSDAAGQAGAAGTVMVASGDRLALRQYLSELYAQHRRVNAMLVTFDALARSVRNISECNAGAPPLLSVTPDVGSLDLKPGNNYQFSVTGGEGGNAFITLGGMIGSNKDGQSKDITLSPSVVGNIQIAKITVPADMPDGVAWLDIADAARKQRLRIKLNILGARSGSDAGAGDDDAGGGEKKTFWDTLSLADRKLVQQNTGAGIDGVWGPNTDRAVREYLKCAGSKKAQLDAAVLQDLKDGKPADCVKTAPKPAGNKGDAAKGDAAKGDAAKGGEEKAGKGKAPGE
jgi:hypothetical protein